jgi:predicted aldo/keto reductase-like oxidoreductase
MTTNLYENLYDLKCAEALKEAEQRGMLIALIGFSIRHLEEKNLTILKKVIDSSNLSEHTLQLITKYY